MAKPDFTATLSDIGRPVAPDVSGEVAAINTRAQANINLLNFLGTNAMQAASAQKEIKGKEELDEITGKINVPGVYTGTTAAAALLEEQQVGQELGALKKAQTIFQDLPPEYSARTKELEEQMGKILTAKSGKVISRSEAITRINALIKKETSDLPFLADSFREMAKRELGTDNLERKFLQDALFSEQKAGVDAAAKAQREEWGKIADQIRGLAADDWGVQMAERASNGDTGALEYGYGLIAARNKVEAAKRGMEMFDLGSRDRALRMQGVASAHVDTAMTSLGSHLTDRVTSVLANVQVGSQDYEKAVGSVGGELRSALMAAEQATIKQIRQEALQNKIDLSSSEYKDMEANAINRFKTLHEKADKDMEGILRTMDRIAKAPGVSADMKKDMLSNSVPMMLAMNLPPSLVENLMLHRDRYREDPKHPYNLILDAMEGVDKQQLSGSADIYGPSFSVADKSPTEVKTAVAIGISSVDEVLSKDPKQITEQDAAKYSNALNNVINNASAGDDYILSTYTKVMGNQAQFEAALGKDRFQRQVLAPLQVKMHASLFDTATQGSLLNQVHGDTKKLNENLVKAQESLRNVSGQRLEYRQFADVRIPEVKIGLDAAGNVAITNKAEFAALMARMRQNPHGPTSDLVLNDMKRLEAKLGKVNRMASNLEATSTGLGWGGKRSEITTEFATRAAAADPAAFEPFVFGGGAGKVVAPDTGERDYSKEKNLRDIVKVEGPTDSANKPAMLKELRSEIERVKKDPARLAPLLEELDRLLAE